VERKSSAYTKRQKEFILKALTEPKFRKALVEDPAKALSARRITPEMEREIALVLAAVKGINAQISALADQLLCANGGPCGIAHA